MHTRTFIGAIALFFVIFTSGIDTAYAQFSATMLSYEGFWAGRLSDVTDDENTVFLCVRIENGQAKRFTYDSDADDFVQSDYGQESSLLVGNNFHFVWLNQGGIWSETQAHSLSFLNPKRLWGVMVRQVTNASEDEDVEGINDEWNVVYEGGLNHYRSLTALREAFLD